MHNEQNKCGVLSSEQAYVLTSFNYLTLFDF